MKSLLILTGPVHSGKTTRLMQWAAAQKNIDGIFQPVIDDKRFIYHIGTRTLRVLETNDNNNAFVIGKYKFNIDVFNWSQNVLLEAIDKSLDWLVIDEIGPLELDGKGLEPVISKIFNQIDELNGNLLCVVRNSILEEFIKHYKLQSKFQLFELH